MTSYPSTQPTSGYPSAQPSYPSTQPGFASTQPGSSAAQTAAAASPYAGTGDPTANAGSPYGGATSSTPPARYASTSQNAGSGLVQSGPYDPNGYRSHAPDTATTPRYGTGSLADTQSRPAAMPNYQTADASAAGTGVPSAYGTGSLPASAASGPANNRYSLSGSPESDRSSYPMTTAPGQGRGASTPQTIINPTVAGPAAAYGGTASAYPNGTPRDTGSRYSGSESYASTPQSGYGQAPIGAGMASGSTSSQPAGIGSADQNASLAKQPGKFRPGGTSDYIRPASDTATADTATRQTIYPSTASQQAGAVTQQVGGTTGNLDMQPAGSSHIAPGVPEAGYPATSYPGHPGNSYPATSSPAYGSGSRY